MPELVGGERQQQDGERQKDALIPEGVFQKLQARLSALYPSGGYQLRASPVGFESAFHCSPHAQWVFVLGGEMRIGLQDGSTRTFRAGDQLYSADLLPEGATFDPKVHGHSSAQAGAEPLTTLFVRG